MKHVAHYREFSVAGRSLPQVLSNASDVNEATTPRAEARTHEAEDEAEAEAEAKTHETEAKAEARIFGLEAEVEFEAKFMRRQKYMKNRKMCNGSLVKTRKHVQNVRN